MWEPVGGEGEGRRRKQGRGVTLILSVDEGRLTLILLSERGGAT